LDSKAGLSVFEKLVGNQWHL